MNTDQIIRTAFKTRGDWSELAITPLDQKGFFLVRVNDPSALRQVDGRMRGPGVVVAVPPEKEKAARDPEGLWAAEAQRAAEIAWTLIDWHDHPERADEYAKSAGLKN